MKAKILSSLETRRHRRGKPSTNPGGRKGQANVAVATKIRISSTQRSPNKSVKVGIIVSSWDMSTMTMTIYLSCRPSELLASPCHLIEKMSFLLMWEISLCFDLGAGIYKHIYVFQIPSRWWF